MNTEIYQEVTGIGDRMVVIVDELCSLLIEENCFIQSANDTSDCDYEALILRKQSLSNDYYLACRSLQDLPKDLKEGLEGYFVANKPKLDRFMSLLSENRELLAARYSRSEKRIDAILAAIDEDNQSGSGYQSQGVIATAQNSVSSIQDIQA